jgi:hypothetical protein
VRTIAGLPKRFTARLRSITTGLSGQVLLLTVIFVFIAEILIFMPTIANMRLAWLRDRLSTAVSIGQVMEGLQADLPRAIQEATLRSMGVDLIALRKDKTSRLLAVVARPLRIDDHYDMREVNGIEAIRDAVLVLIDPKPKLIRVTGDADDSGSRIEIVMNSKPLRDAMVNYLVNVALISLALSVIIGSLIFC